MTREELFSRLWEMLKDTDVDFEHMDEFGDYTIDGELCVCFKNVWDEEITC